MRLQITGFPYHIISRGNNKSTLFHDHHDFKNFLSLLDASRKKFKLLIYNYVLMSNHVHIMIELRAPATLAPAMEAIFKSYAHYSNHKYERTGHVFENRYKSPIIQTDRYFFACSRYINLNPVKAKIADTPQDYRWSSYAKLAYGGSSEIAIDQHELYLKLGRTPRERGIAYKNLVHSLNDDYDKKIQTGRAVIGNKAFKQMIKENPSS